MASLSLLPDMACILSCRIPEPRAETIGCQSTCTILGSMRIHYSSQSHEVLVFRPIRKGILHTWLRSYRVGTRGLSRHRRRQ